MASGMDNYITKPFQPTHLNTMLLALATNERLPDNDNETLTAEAPPPQVDFSGGPVTLQQVAAHLQSSSNLTVEQIERALAATCRSIAGNLTKAETPLGEQDLAALGRAAHTLKGTLLQRGLNDLATKAEEIYHGTRTNNDLPYESLLEQLIAHLTELAGDEYDVNGRLNNKWING